MLQVLVFTVHLPLLGLRTSQLGGASSVGFLHFGTEEGAFVNRREQAEECLLTLFSICVTSVKNAHCEELVLFEPRICLYHSHS